MKSIIKLVVAAIIYLVCLVNAHQQTFDTRSLDSSLKFDALITEIKEYKSRLHDVSLKYHALITELNEHHSHTVGLYLEALLKQKVPAKEPSTDLTEALGFLIEEKALGIQILAAKLQHDLLELEERWAKVGAEAVKDMEGQMILEEVEGAPPHNESYIV